MTRISFPPLNVKLLSGAALLTLLSAGFIGAQSAEDLRLTAGRTVVIDYPSDIRQISTSDPGIIDASPITTREILLNAKGLGTATMVVWSKSGQRTFYNVNVEMNLDPLRSLLKESFPTENIALHSSRDSVTLTGLVSSKDVADRAAALTAAVSKTVVNSLQVREGPIDRQILLRVKFAQLDRSKQEQYGVNLMAAPGKNPIGTQTGQSPPAQLNGNLAVPGGGGTTTMSIAQVLNIFALDPHLDLGLFIKALQQESILEILAEPNLVTSNGREANFLVGGEFPVPVLQGGANSGAVTIQFREFGIRLTFTPQITANNTIKMYLKQEVSTIDIANGVTLSGFTIPALATRRAETNVELGEGQSFIVAGLVDNRERETFSKLPVIGDLPILGALFKSKDQLRSRSELIMMVTPEITEPLGSSDPKPSVYFPKDFLVRLDEKDLQAKQQTSGGPKGKTSTRKK